MSHFTVLVVGDVDEQLAKFDENQELEPRKVHLDEEEIKRMTEHYGTSDETALMEEMEDWTGSEGGIDDDGLYHLSTYNELSKWDWYEVGGRWPNMLVLTPGKDGQSRGEANQAQNRDIDWEQTYSKFAKGRNPEDSPEQNIFHTFAVVTEDGEWHETGRMGWFACSSETPEEKQEWALTFFGKFLKGLSPDVQISIVDCHI